MSTEKTTGTTKKSVFDAWLKDGKLDANAFHQENALTRIRQAIESIHVLAETVPDVSLPDDTGITNTMSLMTYLAHAAKALGDNSKVFANGRRQVVYFATSYACDMLDKEERISILGKMPKMFSYQLGKSPTKAWRDILSNCNIFPHMSRSVGKGELPQAIFSKVSSAVTKIADGYSDPHAKRKIVRAFFDDYWREFGTFATDKDATLDKPNMSELVALWNHRHPKEVTDERTKKRTTVAKEKRQKTLADDILTGKASLEDASKLDETGQAFLAQRVKNAGYKIVARPDLLTIESALSLDHKRKDAIPLLESAMDALGKIEILVSTQLQFARDYASKKTETPELPSVDCSRASFVKAFRFSGKEVSDLADIETITLSRQSNDIHKTDMVGRSTGDNGNVFSTIVTSAKMYTFRNTRKALKGKNEFSVVLVE